MTAFMIGMMIVIGALIGGVTNSIAIKMLFRPYRPIYIENWRVPFTPGLIPKRRVELAEQLGKLVVTHLLTEEGLKKKLESSAFKTEMTEWLKKEVRNSLRSDENILLVAEKWFGISDGKEKLEKMFSLWLTKHSDKVLLELRPKLIKDILPKKLDEKAEQYFPELTAILMNKAKAYFQSEEGIERLSNMVDRFLMGRGALGNMVSMFLGNERLVDKIQPEIIKMLNDDGTHELIEVFLKKEWDKLKNLKVEEIEEHVDLEKIVLFLQEKIKESVPFDYLHKPFYEWTHNYELQITNEFIPKIVNIAGQMISDQLAYLLKKLRLEEVVKEQVEQFSVERLEEMVLSISRKEFKLITYLGALLGGFIGLFQGLIVIFLR